MSRSKQLTEWLKDFILRAPVADDDALVLLDIHELLMSRTTAGRKRRYPSVIERNRAHYLTRKNRIAESQK